MIEQETPRENTNADGVAVGSAPGSQWSMIVVVLVVVSLLRIIFVLPSRANQNDFAHYYLSSRLLIDGSDPYRTPLEPLYADYGFDFDPRIPSATNPPLLLLLMLPFSLLPPGCAFWLWAIFNGLNLIVCLVLIRRLVCTDWSRNAWWSAVAAVLWSYPVLSHFFFSQVQLELAALLLGAFALQKAGRPGAGCVLATVATALKIFPILTLPWFVFYRVTGGRDVLRRLVCVAITGLVIAVATGPGLWQGFLHEGLPVVSSGVMNQRGNLSLPSLILNAASAGQGFVLSPDESRVWWPIASLTGFLVVAGGYAFAWLKRDEPNSAFGVVLLVMVVSGVTAWTHYFVLLIWPAIVTVDLARKNPGTVRRVLTGCMVVLLVVPVDDLLMNAWGNPPIFISLLLSYLPLFATVLTGGLLISTRSVRMGGT